MRKGAGKRSSKLCWFIAWSAVLSVVMGLAGGTGLAKTGPEVESDEEIKIEGGDEEGDEEESVSEEESSGEVIDPEPFEQVLQRYVDEDGMVDYAGLLDSERDRGRLNQVVRQVGQASIENTDESAQLAFFINAYNALVIHAVLQRWPVENVYEEEGFFDGDRHGVAGSAMTLDELDKEVIRKRFDEPRVNFVLVCAAMSCPRLRTTALTRENLDRELQQAAEEYVPKVTRRKGENTIVTSQLFQWYSAEFEEAAGSLAAYLAQYVKSASLREVLRSEEVEIDFSDYDWALNAQ